MRWTEIAAMAITIHSVPAMSAEVERVFSRYDHSSLHLPIIWHYEIQKVTLIVQIVLGF